jgi:glycosyltransferase involved in cell wall biosynthesis
MALPLVSCILATHDRQPFLRQAIKYFLRQTYANKELIIVDDSQEPGAVFVPCDARIRYMKIDPPAPLGSKLNRGIAQASGQIIQKLDDDDYYHPDFLDTTVRTLLGRDPEHSIVGLDCFLVLIAATGELKFSGHGWCAGGTFCFFKRLWKLGAFRDVARAVDWWFLEDHAPERIKIHHPELYMLVRHHAGHLWTTLKGLDVTAHFSRRPGYRTSLAGYLPAEDQEFYRKLQSTAAGLVVDEPSGDV